jgi:hypothetical protein
MVGRRYGRPRAADYVAAARVLSIPLCALIVSEFFLFVPATSSAQQRSKAETDAVSLARQTLAASLSVPPEHITEVGVASIQWRDSSLGCPERGTRYTQAIVSGFAVTLRDTGREHVVHVAGARAVICGARSDERQPPAAKITESLKAADAVRARLAARLGIEPGRVRIVSTRPFRPPVSCAAAPAMPKGVALIVEAEAASQTFRYYADDARVLDCGT